MKIELEIPDDRIQKHRVYVFVGNEMVAIKEVDQPLKVVTQRCSRCGKCCNDVDEKWIMGSTDGVCNHFFLDRGDVPTCKLGGYRPLGCCVDPYDRRRILR